METQLIALRKSIDESSHACVSCMTLVNQSRPQYPPLPRLPITRHAPVLATEVLFKLLSGDVG